MKILHSVLLLLIIIVIAISSILLYNQTLIKDKQKITLNTKESNDEEAVLKSLQNIVEDEKKEAIAKVEREIKAKQKVINKQKPIAKKIFDGKVLYMKRCRLCHGDEKIFINKFSKDKWNKVFNNNSKILLKVHDKKSVSKVTNNYFKTKEYELEVDSLIKYILRH
ncbi:MAG: hypothetical protein L3J10_10370 [Sulfurimonas sp.]|nr:hypothetical protein [Sulfurimonas sp.]